MRYIFLVLLSLTTSISISFAHSPLTSSTPHTSQTLPAPFERFQFTFGGVTKLVKITIETESGTRSDLDLSNNRSAQIEHVVKSEPISPGYYVVYWRALSDDGHPIKGSIPFRVR